MKKFTITLTEYILHQPKETPDKVDGRAITAPGRNWRSMEEETPELDMRFVRSEASSGRQKAYYKDDIRYLNTSVNKLSAMLDNIYNNLLSF